MNAFQSKTEAIRDRIAAENMAGIPGLLADAAAGRNDAAALLLKELAADPSTVGPQVMAAVIANAELWNEATKTICRMAKKAAKEYAAAVAAAAAMPTLDMRPVNRLEAGQAIHIQATTLNRLGAPIFPKNISIVDDDPDNDDDMLVGLTTLVPAYAKVGKDGEQPIYDIAGFATGFHPVYDRHRTLGIVGESGELVDLGIPNPYGASSHLTHHKGDPEGYLRWAKTHRCYNQEKWNGFFARWLKRQEKNEVGRRLDELALKAINGVRIAVVTHEYAGHGQQIVDEVLRRAAQGVHGQIKTAKHGGQRQIGMSAEHYSDRLDRKIIRTETANASGPLHIKYRKSANGNTISPDRLLVLHESPKGEDRFTWLDGMEMSRHGGAKDAPKLDRLALRAANGVTLTVISGRSDEHAASIAAEITRRAWVGVTKNVKVWAQKVCDPWFDYRNLRKIEGKSTQFYVLQQGEKFVLLASPEGKTVTVKPGKAQPLHGYWQTDIDPNGVEYEHWVDVRPKNEAKLRKLFQPVISDWLQEEPREFDEDEDDTHETALESFLTVSDEDAVYMATALAGGNERAADLIRQNFDPEAAAEIEDEPRGGGRRGGPSAEKSALDKMFEDVASAQTAKVVGARQATLSIIAEQVKAKLMTEEQVARIAHDAGYRDITITWDPTILSPTLDKDWLAQVIARNQGITRKWSAQGQFMGSKPIVVAINDEPLTEAQRLEWKQKKYTYFAPLAGVLPGSVIPKSAMTMELEAERHEAKLLKMAEQNAKAAEILAEKTAEDEALMLKAVAKHQWLVQPLPGDNTKTVVCPPADYQLPAPRPEITEDKALAGWRIIDTTSAVLLAEIVADAIA